MSEFEVGGSEQVYVLMLSEVDHDSYWCVGENRLSLCFAEPDLAKRKDVLKGGLTAKSIHSSKEVQVSLVLDGHEDEESWKDLYDWFYG